MLGVPGVRAAIEPYGGILDLGLGTNLRNSQKTVTGTESSKAGWDTWGQMQTVAKAGTKAPSGGQQAPRGTTGHLVKWGSSFP